eukprot:scaffold7465_cov30-Tisochrysis_lutea.AAC.1
MEWRDVCTVSTANILPEGSRRSRRPVGKRLIDEYIENERDLFIEDIGLDELEYAVLGSLTDDDDVEDDGSDRPDEEEEDPDYVEEDTESSSEVSDDDDYTDDEEDEDDYTEEDDEDDYTEEDDEDEVQTTAIPAFQQSLLRLPPPPAAHSSHPP